MDINQEKEIYMMQDKYINGHGNYGPVLKEYSDILNKYKSALRQCIPFAAVGLDQMHKDFYSVSKDKLKTDIGLVIAILIWSLLFPSKLGWCIMCFIMGFVVFGVKYIRDDDGKWWILALVGGIFAVILAVAPFSKLWIWAFLFIPLGINALIQAKDIYVQKNQKYHEINKNRVIQMREQEHGLVEIRKQLKKIEPDLRKEYQQVIADKLKDQDIGNINRYNQLPKKFWWEISPSELYEEKIREEDKFSEFLSTQEVKPVVRSKSPAFSAAGEEYAPLYAENCSIENVKSYYIENKELLKINNGIIIDFINCIQYSKFVTQTDTVDVYKKNIIERKMETAEWNSLGNDMQDAYIEGSLSDADYAQLKLEYDNANADVLNSINQKTTETREITKMKYFAKYAWTGQVLLMPDVENNNRGYILLDYRCRPEYLIENLEKLKGYHITRVWDMSNCENVYFMAKIQQMVNK